MRGCPQRTEGRGLRTEEGVKDQRVNAEKRRNGETEKRWDYSGSGGTSVCGGGGGGGNCGASSSRATNGDALREDLLLLLRRLSGDFVALVTVALSLVAVARYAVVKLRSRGIRCVYSVERETKEWNKCSVIRTVSEWDSNRRNKQMKKGL